MLYLLYRINATHSKYHTDYTKDPGARATAQPQRSPGL